MMFSSKSRYALRVMLDLARQSADGYVPLNDIVVRQNISRKYLETIMNALCKGRLVESTVGKSGGYRLLRPPAEYTAGEILRAAEGNAVAPVACLAANGKKCDGACDGGTLPFWHGLEDHINAYIDGCTLADLLHTTNTKGEVNHNEQ